MLITSVLLLILLLFFFDTTKNDYFWIIIAFILIDYPASLYLGIDRNFLQFSYIKLGFIEVFSVVSLFKVKLKYKNIEQFPSLLKKPYLVYFLWLVFLMFYGILFYGISGGGRTGFRYLYILMKLCLALPLFYTLPRMLSDGKITRFAQLLFILLHINFLGQIYSIIVGNSLHNLLGGAVPESIELFIISDELVRPLFGSLITLTCILIASYYLYSKWSVFSTQYLSLNIIICFFSIIVTGSRTWIIGYVFFIFFLLMISLFSYRKKSILFRFIVFSIPVILFFISSNIFSKQIDALIIRLNTLNYFVHGDLTAGGTNIRFTSRPERVMEKFVESPIIGWGISHISMDYWDGHVGNQSILLVGGIIGFALIIYLWFHIVVGILKFKKQKNNTISRQGRYVLIIYLALTIIIHWGTQRYGFLVYGFSPSTAFTTALFLSVIAILFQSNDNNR